MTANQSSLLGTDTVIFVKAITGESCLLVCGLYKEERIEFFFLLQIFKVS